MVTTTPQLDHAFRPRGFQFSLRSVLIAMTVLAIVASFVKMFAGGSSTDGLVKLIGGTSYLVIVSLVSGIVFYRQANRRIREAQHAEFVLAANYSWIAYDRRLLYLGAFFALNATISVLAKINIGPMLPLFDLCVIGTLASFVAVQFLLRICGSKDPSMVCLFPEYAILLGPKFNMPRRLSWGLLQVSFPICEQFELFLDSNGSLCSVPITSQQRAQLEKFFTTNHIKYRSDET